MGFFGMLLKPGQKEAVEVPPGWCLQLCTAAIEPGTQKANKDIAATLWLQVEGEIGDTSYLLGSLRAGGACAQMPVAHCLTSVDGEVVVEAKGTGNVHLTGFFNREIDPDIHGEFSSDEEDSEENSDDDDALIMKLKRVKQKLQEEEEEEEESDYEEHALGKRGGSKRTASAALRRGRSVRSAAAAAALACGTGGGEDDDEDDSEADGEYTPGDDEDEKEDEDDDEDEDECKGSSNGDDGDGGQAEAGSRGAGVDGGVKRKTSASPASPAAAMKRSRSEEKDEAAAGGEDGGPELTKQERKRQRKRENKRKAAEAKKSLEEAFSAMDADDGEPPIGVPLKNPRSKTLKGGLKITDTTLGGGKVAMPGKNIKVCYEGCFPNGRVFDKNQNRRRPLQFRVGMQKVIVGMDRGVEGMRVGGSREISIPAALGYGARGTGPIPANQDLVFRVELIEVLGK